MTEPISVPSGLLAFVTFACQSSVILFKTIQSFRTHPKRVRDLTEELEALIEVLQSLTDTTNSTTGVDFSALELPLQQCGKACEEFEQELVRCSLRAGGNRTSFRDWAKLRYMGDDIDGFRHLLAGYKSTIAVVLLDVNIRQSSITAEKLESFRDLITTATDDLEARLESIDEKLETIFARTATDLETREVQRIREERLSTQRCLLICAQLSEHIKQIEPISAQRNESSFSDSGVFSEKITSDVIRECKTSLDQTTAKLEKHMQDLIDRLIAKSNTALSPDEVANLSGLREQWATIRQCRDICSKSDQHLKENISIIDNHATGDEAVQFLVSTSEKTIHGKNRGYGFRIRQVGGHLNDESVQQLSRDMSRISSQNPADEKLSSRIDTVSDVDNVGERETNWKDYGNGRKIAPQLSPDERTTPKPLHEATFDDSRWRSGGG